MTRSHVVLAAGVGAVGLAAFVATRSMRQAPAPIVEPDMPRPFTLPDATGDERPSDRLIDLLRSFESFAPRAYQDGRGRSIGYGHQIQPGEDLTFVTVQDADRLLVEDAARALRAVDDAVDRLLVAHQRDALASFVYNVGEAAFRGSTLLRKLNALDDAGAAREFGRWIYTTAGGKKVQSAGLAARRRRERALFEGYE